jgi:hypothetical protein
LPPRHLDSVEKRTTVAGQRRNRTGFAAPVPLAHYSAGRSIIASSTARADLDIIIGRPDPRDLQIGNLGGHNRPRLLQVWGRWTRLGLGPTSMGAFMSTFPERSYRFPGRSDQRDHARIRRRCQDELPRHALHRTPAKLGGQQGSRLLGFPISNEARPIGPFMREYGVAAARVLVQLAWVYAAAERSSHHPERKDRPILESADSGPTSTQSWLQARLAQAIQPARHTIEAVLGWLAHHPR